MIYLEGAVAANNVFKEANLNDRHGVLMKKTLVILAMILSPPAFAGGVSDGGGGTTNPSPIDPDMIAYRVGEFGRIILTWANHQEENFKNLTPSEQAASPYAKLFLGTTKFVDVIKSTGFELRMNGPCFDAQGAEKEGSVYASKPGYLCLSPFLMGPKLSELNFEAETTALMIHELSHVLGASEAEAVQIQRDALGDLSHFRFLDAYVDMDLLCGATPSANPLGGRINEAIGMARYWLKYPAQMIIKGSEVQDWKNGFTVLLNTYFDSRKPVSYASLDLMKLYRPYYVPADVLEDYVISQDGGEAPSRRYESESRLEKAFGANNTATAREVIQRQDGIDLGSDFDLVTIRRPRNSENVQALIQSIVTYMESLRAEVRFNYDFRTPTYRTN